MNTIAEVVNALQSRQRWLVTSHSRPDGDAVGSLLGCVQILRSMGQPATGHLRDGVPFIYRHLPNAAAIGTGPLDASGFEAALILECDCFGRTPGWTASARSSPSTSTITETSAELYADVNCVVPDACAAAEHGL